MGENLATEKNEGATPLYEQNKTIKYFCEVVGRISSFNRYLQMLTVARVEKPKNRQGERGIK